MRIRGGSFLSAFLTMTAFKALARAAAGCHRWGAGGAPRPSKSSFLWGRRDARTQLKCPLMTCKTQGDAQAVSTGGATRRLPQGFPAGERTSESGTQPGGSGSMAAMSAVLLAATGHMKRV